MKELYIASFCHNGILGGALYLTDDCAVYRTNKLTVNEKYRNLRMPYREISAIEADKLLFIPTVSITLTDGSAYKFIVFARKKFIARLKEMVRA